MQNEKEIAIHAKTGTRITNEFGKTALALVHYAPGQIFSIYFTYRLPFKVIQDNSDNQKQSFWTLALVATGLAIVCFGRNNPALKAM